MQERQAEVYAEGQKAYHRGESWTNDNPYNGGAWEEVWSMGFEDAAHKEEEV